MIAAYLAMYRAEGDPLDLEKAKALADAITQVQEPSGRVPTFWSAGSKAGWLAEERYDWLNCMASCAKALMDVADVVGHKRCHHTGLPEARPPIVADDATDKVLSL